MYSTWEFLKRNRSRILAGTAVAATIYAAKCVLESPSIGNSVKQYFQKDSEDLTTIFDDECLNEARRHFLFDVHQQSCDKTLHKLVMQLRQRIDARFDIADLLDKLNNPKLDPQRKIEIWEQMKIQAIAKILSVITIFPLVTLVMKTQKSMICQHIYHSIPKKRIPKNSLYENGLFYLKSFFNPEEDRQALTVQNSTKTQNLFNSSLQFLFTEGIDLLFGILEQIAMEIFSPIKLTEQFGTMDLHFLLEQARARIKAIGALNNFSEFVVPSSQLSLQISSQDETRLNGLLKQFALVLQTQMCRKLMDQFSGQYFEAVLQHLDEAIPQQKTLPLAKLIPRLCNFIPLITASDYTSVFNGTLISTDLHQFTLFVSQCSKVDAIDELNFGSSLDNGSLFEQK